MAQAQLKSQRTTRDWPFKVKPLHPVLGCEITGITLAEAVSPAMFAKVYEAFLEYELILFRDVDLPPATQVAVARNFGEVQIHVLSQYHGYKKSTCCPTSTRTAIQAASTRIAARCTGTPMVPGRSAPGKPL